MYDAAHKTIVLKSPSAADYVVTGCGTGEGAMLAVNSFPNIICSHVEDPADTDTFAHVNDGDAVTVEVRISEADFRAFSAFDLLKRRKAWMPTVRRSAALLIIAGICAIKWLQLGALLLIVALALVCLYFFNFYRSLEKQVKKLGLKEAKYAYTLTLDPTDANGIAVWDGERQRRYQWKRVFGAYRDEAIVYLYTTESRAFLLPTACLPNRDQDGLWSLLSKRLPDNRRVVL